MPIIVATTTTPFTPIVREASTTDAKTILDKASILLNDSGVTRWTVSELLGWLNDAQLEVATLVPNSNTVTSSILLQAGSIQGTPSNAIRIIEFIRNTGADGVTPGNAIRQIERKSLDRYLPNWSNDTPATAVVHAMYDAEDNNTVFYVWPPQTSVPRYIEINYSVIPATIANATAGTKITIADYYANALLDYILYRAFAKDADSANQAARSLGHYKQFADAIGAKFGADNNANNTPKAQ